MGGGIGFGGFRGTSGSKTYQKWLEQNKKTDKNNSSSKNKERFYGKPGEVKKEGYSETLKGYSETLIGKDGRATKERHHTDHENPKQHTNPHDHYIDWKDNGNPDFSKPINYWEGYIPKLYTIKGENMQEYDNNFLDADDLIECLERHCEVEFFYNNKKYAILHPENRILIGEGYNESSEQIFDNPISTLSYKFDDDKCLGEILQDMKIIFRSF